jgi:hypothetical protein
MTTEQKPAHSLTETEIAEMKKRRKLATMTIEDRLKDVCPGCGLHAIKDERCTLCGTEKKQQL